MTASHDMTELHDEPNDEFRFLRGDADRVGARKPLPNVRRVETTSADGRSLSALQFDPTSAPRFVFLHGMGLNAHGFDPVALALDSPTLALDLPGHGRSDWRDDADYGPDKLWPDAARVMNEFAPEPFALVGHSLGGLTAVLAASALSERLRALVLIDVTPGIQPQGDAGAISDFISEQRAFDSQEDMVERAIAFGIGEDRAALTRGVALNSRLRPDGRWEWAHHFAHMDAAPAASLGEGRPFASLWEPLSTLHSAGLPVVLIRASDGIVSDELVAEWGDRLPEAAALTVTGPHNLHEASPLELAHALESLPL